MESCAWVVYEYHTYALCTSCDLIHHVNEFDIYFGAGCGTSSWHYLNCNHILSCYDNLCMNTTPEERPPTAARLIQYQL